MQENEMPISLREMKMSEEEIAENLRQLPAVIRDRSQLLSDLQQKVEEAKKAAKTAKEKAEAMPGYKEKKWWKFTIRKGNTKDIVEGSLDITKEIAKAQQLNAEALNLTHTFQQELTKVTEFLFYLGCYNIAANESMIASLNKQLKGDTEGVLLSAEVKEQFRNVVKRLKAQQDVLYRQQKLEEASKESQTRLAKYSAQQEKLEQRLLEKDTTDEEQTRQINQINELLKQKTALDDEQSKRIKDLQNAINEMKMELKKESDSSRIKQIVIGIISALALGLGILNYFS